MAEANRIQVLPDHLINKIAAGEVIDRPSSVVKELVENSIDAGAESITVVLKNGGKSLIQVIDDGCGMTEEDAILSIQRHATSKIHHYRDIEHITTLGFRGEALASIAAVSRTELRSVPRGEIEGTVISIEGGAVQRVDKTGGNPGTLLSVKNIFFNTPARRKFLRADNTEYRHILRIMNRFTLSYPQLSFTLIHDDKQVFQLRPADMKSRIAEIMGSRVADNLIEVRDDTAVANITGFIGNFDVLRKSRTDQFLFLNSRYISDKTINYAIASGYGDMLPQGQFPLYILFLEVDPERVDVNVHPTKSEVKFADQQMLYTVIRSAIKRALTLGDALPDLSESTGTSLDFSQGMDASSVLNEIRTYSQRQTQLPLDQQTSRGQAQLSLEADVSRPGMAFDLEPTPSSLPRQEEPPSAAGGAVVWQLGGKYLVSQIKSGLVVIDQHQAHKRVLFDRARRDLQQSDASSQQLLFPRTVELSAEDFETLMEILPFLSKIGFIIKGFGGRTVVIEGVPTGMRIGEEDKWLLGVIDDYRRNAENGMDIPDRVAHSFARRTAIPEGERLSPQAMNALIDQLFATTNPYNGPGGKTIMITIGIDDLDKRFERK